MKHEHSLSARHSRGRILSGSSGGSPFTCLVTAIGSYSAESVISSLREHWDARVVGTNTQPHDWCTTSALLDAFHRVPAARNVTEYVERVLNICEIEHVTHVLPLIDPEVDAFALHHEVFAERGITLCMQPLETIRVARDKWLVHQAFRNDPLIRTIPTWRLEDLPVSGLDLPLIAKPRDGRNCEGLMQVRDADSCTTCASASATAATSCSRCCRVMSAWSTWCASRAPANGRRWRARNWCAHPMVRG